MSDGNTRVRRGYGKYVQTRVCRLILKIGDVFVVGLAGEVQSDPILFFDTDTVADSGHALQGLAGKANDAAHGNGIERGKLQPELGSIADKNRSSASLRAISIPIEIACPPHNLPLDTAALCFNPDHSDQEMAVKVFAVAHDTLNHGTRRWLKPNCLPNG